jgi:uncharacterized protein YndB with AHSA1/START domain
MTTKNNKTEPLVIERTFNAPIAQVWKAITTKEEMKRWFFDIEEFNRMSVLNFSSTARRTV